MPILGATSDLRLRFTTASSSAKAQLIFFGGRSFAPSIALSEPLKNSCIIFPLSNQGPLEPCFASVNNGHRKSGNGQETNSPCQLHC